MPKSPKKVISDARWNAKAYYRPTIYLRREFEESVHNRANELNMSMSEYIQTLIKKDLDQHII